MLPTPFRGGLFKAHKFGGLGSRRLFTITHWLAEIFQGISSGFSSETGRQRIWNFLNFGFRKAFSSWLAVTTALKIDLNQHAIGVKEFKEETQRPDMERFALAA